MPELVEMDSSSDEDSSDEDSSDGDSSEEGMTLAEVLKKISKSQARVERRNQSQTPARKKKLDSEHSVPSRRKKTARRYPQRTFVDAKRSAPPRRKRSARMSCTREPPKPHHKPRVGDLHESTWEELKDMLKIFESSLFKKLNKWADAGWCKCPGTSCRGCASPTCTTLDPFPRDNIFRMEDKNLLLRSCRERIMRQCRATAAESNRRLNEMVDLSMGSQQRVGVTRPAETSSPEDQQQSSVTLTTPADTPETTHDPGYKGERESDKHLEHFEGKELDTSACYATQSQQNPNGCTVSSKKPQLAVIGKIL
jgi:hypothetical protein